jgi:hypothetical protein
LNNGARLKKLQLLSILTIAIVLVIHLYLSQIHPRFILSQNETKYLALAKECNQAVSERRQILQLRMNVSARSIQLLKQTSGIFMMICHQQKVLRLSLLNSGVFERELDLIELRAKQSSTASLPYSDIKTGRNP